ncbi:MAG: right-handed parallel beta-helix repeat-containing protein [Oscillospiraceae bacterium]
MINLSFPSKDENLTTLRELSEWLLTQTGNVKVEFLSGEYYGTLNLINLKCDSLKLIGNGKVSFTGVYKLHCDFKRFNKNTIVATLPKGLDFERLKIGDKQGILARYPNFKEDEILNGYSSLEMAEKALKNCKDIDKVYLRALHENEWGGNSYKVKGLSDNGFDLEWIGDNNRGDKFKKDCVVVENAFELIDSENEWFYNSESGELFLFDDKNDNIKLDIEIMDIINLINVECCKSTDISIENIDFIDTERNMFKTPWVRYLRSDWAFNFGSTISIKNSSDINILNCNFKNLGSNAIGIFDYANNITIDNCDFENCNTNGILILGNKDSTYCTSSWDNDNHISLLESPDKKGARSNNYPRNISIDNCYFYNLGQEDKQSAGICISLSHKVSILNSTFHHLPRAGINICENAFGGHIIESCDIFDCVAETGDHGPFNSWGRDRFWSLKGYNTSGCFGKWKKPYAIFDMLDKNVIRHNRIDGTHGFGIDLDDGSSNYLIENNLCINKGIKLREGFFRTVRNNIIINAPIDLHATFKGNDDEIYNNIVLNYNPLNVIIVNRGFTTKIFDNYFVNADESSKKQKLLKNQSNFFVFCKLNDVLNQTFEFENFKKFDFNFGKCNKPTPALKINEVNKSEHFKNSLGEFSTLDEFSRSMSGSPDFNGLYVDKLSAFSKLKSLGVKKDDVIISINGTTIKNGIVDFKKLKSKNIVLEIIRQQKLTVIGRN